VTATILSSCCLGSECKGVINCQRNRPTGSGENSIANAIVTGSGENLTAQPDYGSMLEIISSYRDQWDSEARVTVDVIDVARVPRSRLLAM